MSKLTRRVLQVSALLLSLIIYDEEKTVIKKRKRTRKSVSQIKQELGDAMFRRAFRMNYDSFCSLYTIIKPDLLEILKYRPHDNSGPNGRIRPNVRLACTLRFFSGGDPLDLITSFGVSKTAVHDSINLVIEAVTKCKMLEIKFPTSHENQRRIAEGFQKKSKAGFSKCVGAIDGMLIWITKPSEKECNKVGVGSKKFFCGRKKSMD